MFGYGDGVTDKRKRVLVVDDDAEIRRFICEVLTDAGHEAQPAVDGDHALRSAVALRPDLIILDVHLPEPSAAVRFADSYRERVDAEHRAPIIALSGAADLETVGRRIGATDYLGKPFTIDALLQCVAKLVGEPEAVVVKPVPSEEPTTQVLPEAEPGPATP
jgi:DNA-binding response OmpR family regulator